MSLDKFIKEKISMITAKISIIVPIYNAEQFLEKCILSIINQEYTNLEIILVNDGSTDNSLEICNSYSKIDDRIIVIDKQNGGVSSARNCGLDVATGDHIGFVDSDDFISPEMYKILIEKAVENNADITECGYYICTTDNEIIDKYEFYDLVINGNYECSYNYIASLNRTTDFNWNKLYKSHIFEDIRFPNYAYSEDFVVNTKAFYKCYRKIEISGCYYHYVQHEDSAVNKAFNKSRIDGIKAGIEMYNFHFSRFNKLCPFIACYITVYTVAAYNILCKSNQLEKEKYKKELMLYFKKYYTLIKGDAYKFICFKKIGIKFMIFNINPNIYENIINLKK